MTADPLARRVDALEALFRHIAATRMDGVPVLNDRLAVRAVGFEAVGEAACGVLVTPWFMNLVWLPAPDEAALAPGASRARVGGAERFDFIGAREDAFGAYEACSLFSPMFGAGRVVGWTAHVAEQQRTGRLIRPASRYVGQAPR